MSILEVYFFASVSKGCFFSVLYEGGGPLNFSGFRVIRFDSVANWIKLDETQRNLKSISFKKGAKKDCCTKFPENLPMSKRKQKIAGRKRPALVYPSHKVRQGGKGKYGYWVPYVLSSGLFPFGRVSFATSWVDFRSAECVPPRPGQFPVGRVCSAMSRVDFQSAEYFRSIRISSD